jgi:hypothetical protein
MTTEPKPVVGQVLYSLNVGNMARDRKQKLTRVVVTKVGRKYFTCLEEDRPEHMSTQFYLDGWQEKSDYDACQKLYESKQAYEDEVEVRRISRKILNRFEYSYRGHNIPLTALRTIEGILDANSGEEKSNGSE